MKRKCKVLITGNNKAVIDGIFKYKTDFECLSSSCRLDDIMGHLKYFEPDAFVYCLQAEKADDINIVRLAGPKIHQAYVPIIIIGDQRDCNDFQKQAYDTSDLILVKPVSMPNIRDSIIQVAGEWEQKKNDAGIKKEEVTQTVFSGTDEEEPEKAMDVLKELEDEVNKTASGKKRGHILVVDDDPRMLKVIRANLRDEYDVASAVNGKLALKFLEKKKTDLILLDYEMPGMKGPDVFRILKHTSELSDIPVVFLTGVGELSKVQEVLEMKPQGYLLKPVDRSKLRSCVQNLIG